MLKKISIFIVRFRYILLISFIALAGISLYFGNQVKVNHDITKYMPESSETAQGKAIMDQEFSEVETSTLSVMFDDLENDKKSEVKSYLENIEGVKTVAYDDSEEYNKDNHTLYTLTVDAAADSELASRVFDTIKNKYADNYTLNYSGDVASNNADVVAVWIIALGIIAAMIILIILCDSFVEPFLFLFSIGLAVFINSGTNIIFPEISHITKAIAAILQLALSMDYSIMLMNRYRQEKQAIGAKTKADNQKAMKSALAHSFGSISSSSITTVVGLFVLVFMSFTIGRDMGLIMSKGVILSLLTIFTCLPGLILLFDPWIEKTTKRHSINFKMTLAGKFAYKFRIAAPIVFVALLVGSFLLKGNVGITYTGSENNKVGEVFPKTNQIAVIYDNTEEDKVGNYCRSYEDADQVKQVLCYGNTINEPEKVTELVGKMNDLGEELDVEDYLLRVVYYHYYNPDETHTLTVDDFVKFVQNDILTNPKLAKHLSSDSIAQINRLSNFTDLGKAQQERGISELANILEIDASQMKDLLVLYGAKNPTNTLTLEQVLNFIANDIYGTEYASEIPDTMRATIASVQPFVNKSYINTEMSATELATLFGLDESTVQNLMFYREYISRTDTDLTMSTAELLQLISNDETLKSQLADNQLLSALLSNPTIVEQLVNIPGSYNYTDMATVLSNAISQYATAIFTADPTATIAGLNYQQFMGAIGSMQSSLGATLKQVYVYRTDQIAAATATMSPYTLVDFILAHANDSALAGKINSSTLATLGRLKTVMNAVNAETRFTATELAEFLGVNSESLKLLYSYYNYLYVNPNPTMSLYNTIKFILSDIIPSAKYSNRLSADKQAKVLAINNVMDNALANTLYDHTGLYQLLSPLSSNLTPKTIDIAYIYHGSKTEYNEEWTLTVEKFVNYLNDNILQDARLNDLIDDEMKLSITSAKDTVAEAKRMLVGNKYSRAVFNTNLEPEGEETFNFIRKLKETFSKDSKTPVYTIGDSPMALEMSETFNNEMNFITILTMAAIFVVVAITFKSIIIPLILVLIIQTAVWVTMAAISFAGEPIYFISIIIVQSILMGATIDYAILYTSYYLENRRSGKDIKSSLTNSYRDSFHTILCSASVLVIVTAIVGTLASAIAAKICTTISIGTLFSALLILIVLPAMLAGIDKIIIRKK